MAEPCLDLGYPGSQCSPPPGRLCLSLASVLVLSLSQTLGSWSRSDFRGPGIIVLAPKVQSGAVTRDQALTPSSRVLASPYRRQPPLPHLPREEGGRGRGEASRGRLACPFSQRLVVVWGAEWHRDPRGKSDNRRGAHRGVVVCLPGHLSS